MVNKTPPHASPRSLARAFHAMRSSVASGAAKVLQKCPARLGGPGAKATVVTPNYLMGVSINGGCPKMDDL